LHARATVLTWLSNDTTDGGPVPHRGLSSRCSVGWLAGVSETADLNWKL